MRPFQGLAHHERSRQLKWPHLRQIGNLETVRAKRTRAAGMSRTARALRSDVVRRAASRGGTLRCAKARRVAYRDVDESYASQRLSSHGCVARRLQDSAAVVVAISFDRAEKAATAATGSSKSCNGRFWALTATTLAHGAVAASAWSCVSCGR